MSSIPGYSDNQLSAWKQQAAKSVAYFDKNGNGGIDADEVKKFSHKDTDTRDNYWIGDFCNRTYTYYDVYRKVDAEKLKVLDANKDGKVTADEVHEAHRAALPKRDLDGDGKVGFFEKLKAGFKASAPSVASLLGERSERVLTGQETKNEYSPFRKDWSWAPKF